MELSQAFTHVMVAYTDGRFNLREESDTLSVNGVDYPILTPADYWVGDRSVLMLTIDKSTNSVKEANLAIGLRCEHRVPTHPQEPITIEFTGIQHENEGVRQLADKMLARLL